MMRRIEAAGSVASSGPVSAVPRCSKGTVNGVALVYFWLLLLPFLTPALYDRDMLAHESRGDGTFANARSLHSYE